MADLSEDVQALNEYRADPNDENREKALGVVRRLLDGPMVKEHVGDSEEKSTGVVQSLSNDVDDKSTPFCYGVIVGVTIATR